MKNNLKVPVVFFTYRKYDTVLIVFSEIQKVKPKKLYHVSDAANNYEDQLMVKKIRDYVSEHINWNCEFIQIYADQNMGCEKRIISGLNQVFEKEEMAIILEDDILPSQDFFYFCQVMLEEYYNEERVMMITGNNLAPSYKSSFDYYFSRYTNIWGWATWRRAWKHMDASMEGWKKIENNRMLFQYFGENTATTMTREYKYSYESEKNWDYCWAISKMLRDGLEIVPSVNLVENIGILSEYATHKSKRNIDMPIENLEKPITIRNEIVIDSAFDKEMDLIYYYVNPIEKVIRKIIPATWLRKLGQIVKKI